MKPETAAMLSYVNSLRNPNKKDYATRYAIWLERSEEDRTTVVEPRPFGLTYMGAQAVRTALHRICNQMLESQ